MAQGVFCSACEACRLKDAPPEARRGDGGSRAQARGATEIDHYSGRGQASYMCFADAASGEGGRGGSRSDAYVRCGTAGPIDGG